MFEASCVKEDIVWFRVSDSTSENKRRNRITVEKMIPYRFVLQASCVIRRCDNHYSLAFIGLQRYKDSESMVKWHVLEVCIIATLFAKKRVHRDPRFYYLVLLNSVNTSYKFFFKAENKYIVFVIRINCVMLFCEDGKYLYETIIKRC